jgi:hypothetical protein
MTLLAQLKDPTRNYWIVPVSPTGTSDHPDFKIVHVTKGANIVEIEVYCEMKEREMIEILEGVSS